MITSTKPKRRKTPTTISCNPDRQAILARRLDLLAGCELQHGHHLAAERLARLADDLRAAIR